MGRKVWLYLELLAFVGVLYAALWPVRAVLVITAAAFYRCGMKRGWLFLAIAVTAGIFLFFGGELIRLSGSAYSVARRAFIEKPEAVKLAVLPEKPVISIVIPAYNYEQYVGEAVRSAAEQKSKVLYEVVVIDDGSSDETLAKAIEAALEYPHVSVYRQKENTGLITAKNAGIELARGEWIYNLDADDWLEADALETLFSLVTGDRGEFVYSSIYEVIGSKRRAVDFCYGQAMLEFNCVPNFAMYKKSDWEAVGRYGYWFSGGLEDWDFALSFARGGRRVLQALRPVYNFSVKEGGRSTKADKAYSWLWWVMQVKHAKIRGEFGLRARAVFYGFWRFGLEDYAKGRGARYKYLGKRFGKKKEV